MTSAATRNPVPARLAVIYDETCELCRRSGAWLAAQQTRVPLILVAAGSPAATERFAGVPWLGEELLVAADDGRTWVGPAAFVMCLWATRDHWHWAHRLSSPGLAPVAERVIAALSANRGRVSAWLHPRDCDARSCSGHPAP